MKKSMMHQMICLMTLSTTLLISNLSIAKTEQTMNTSPMTTTALTEKAIANTNWKTAFATANHAQVVFMNVSPATNPKNEIGMETHPFDQVIIIAAGHAKVELNGKTSMVNTGDMIFIPQGTAHNVINLNQNQPLKVISFYSSNDIPANSSYKTKADEPTS